MSSLSNTSNYIFSIKQRLRNLWSGYFGFRYLNSTSVKNFGPVFRFSYNRWRNVSSPLIFEESKYIELFEAADKSKFIAASLLTVDISEVNSSIDNFREAYPFTTAFAKFNRILKLKDNYTHDLDGYYLEEVKNCFVSLEKYCQVYTTIYQMASLGEEIKLLLNRSYIHPKKKTLRHVFAYNKYDTEERLHSDLKILLENYKNILEDLKEFPMWREKFEIDIGKLFAFTNTVFDTPEIYGLIDQQKIFK